MIIGEFNFPDINWDNWPTAKNEHHDCPKFMDCIMDCYLNQHISDETRMRERRNTNTIDLVFTNMEHMIENLEIEPLL